MSAAGIRRLARSRDGARKGAVGAYQRRRPRGRGDPAEPPARAGERPLHREELGGRVVVVLRGGLVGDGGHTLAQLLESGGQRRQLGQGADTPR